MENSLQKQEHAARLLITIGEAALKNRAQRVLISSSDGVTLVDSQGSNTSVPTKECPITDLTTCVSERAAVWPELNDPLFATNPRKKRLLLTLSNHTLAQCDVVQLKDGVTQLENFVSEENARVLDRFSMSPEQQTLFGMFIGAHEGVVLVSNPGKHVVVEAAHVILAMRPDAVLYSAPPGKTTVNELIEQSQRTLVLVRTSAPDPIAASLEILAAADEPEKEDRLLKALRGVFLQRWVRRVCGGCARPTAISSQIANKIPTFLLPAEDATYMFGRGCEKCGHGSYRGFVSLESIVAMNNEIRGILKTRAGVQKAVEAAYRSGTRALLEDGVAKINRGLTSFEEITGACPQISEALASVISASRHKQAQTGPISASERKLEAFNGDFFSDSGAVKQEEAPKKPHLLIVEDDQDQREVLSIVFRKEGYDATGAESGKAALKLLEKKSYDCIICDLMMPEMNGEELIKAVRASTTLKNIPILMLTAMAAEDQEYNVLSMGADDFCPKTVKRKVLLKRVEKLLERRPGNPVQHLLGD